MFLQLDFQFHDLTREPVTFVCQNTLAQLLPAEVDAVLQNGCMFLHGER